MIHEDADAKKANAVELEQENIQRQGVIDHKRWRAEHVSESFEARALQEINSNVQRENERRRQTDRPGRSTAPKECSTGFPI